MFRYKEGDRVKYTPVGGMMPLSLKDTCPKTDHLTKYTRTRIQNQQKRWNRS